MMPSELALQIARRNKETIETVGALRLANDADAELSEVREVLRDLKRGPVGREGSCWCTGGYYKPPRHSTKCQRARDLYQKLRADK